MRPKRISKFVASLAVCGLLLVVSAASAAAGNLSKPKGKGTAGPLQDKEAFLASLSLAGGDASCESDCCWAWVEDCYAGYVLECSSHGCFSSCGEDWAAYICENVE
jgi:hypothetical protein